MRDAKRVWRKAVHDGVSTSASERAICIIK